MAIDRPLLALFQRHKKSRYIFEKRDFYLRCIIYSPLLG
ncbi:hypothetical protein D1BOALGB6SA_6806 [Olavius sp. associated proteobacterium Delta 1]|nr:hypothetical protein D1BOALGB6SA_6806 [Olavius sp. associated proteobacterium Delta 1]